ncbi:MAG: hypothetical protein K6E20_03425, partial [Acholeplasmatales bacterium]|nr:hypothetical protein [Acholeplasmatales bacterium]
RFGVKWKKKNSYSFYFNDNDLYNTRNYFIDGADSTKIKLVSDKNGVHEISRSELQYAPLKGIRKSDIIEYDIRKVIDDRRARMPYDLFRKKLNNLLRIVKYLKKEISLSELKQMFDSGLITKENDNFSYNDFIEEIKNEKYKKCENIKVPYGQMGNSLSEIEAKKLIEASIEQFIYSYNLKDNGSVLMDSFFDIINSIVPEQQKNKLGKSVICTEANLAALLCTDNIFLSLYKMKVLGDIINLGSQRVLTLTCKNDDNKPVYMTLYGGKSSVSIEEVSEKRVTSRVEHGEIIENTSYETKKAYRTNSKLSYEKASISFVSKGDCTVKIYAKSRREIDKLLVIDDNETTLASPVVTGKPNLYTINFNYSGRVQIGFENDYGFIYSIDVKTKNDKFGIDFDSLDYKQHNKEKIIIFCKDDAERRLLVNNSHIWDYEGRYRANDKSIVEAAKQSELSFDREKANTVSIAYTTDAEGLNLQSYHTMIHYSIVLSPLHMEQRVGRIDRIGQKNEMDIYFLANAQDIEGYILRFFEYELELFSNWSGDTTASTYVDSNVGGKSVKKEFDVFCSEVWKNIVINGNQNESIEERVASFERTIVDAFDNVRERVKMIAGYSGQIDEMTQRHEVLDEEGFELYYN